MKTIPISLLALLTFALVSCGDSTSSTTSETNETTDSVSAQPEIVADDRPTEEIIASLELQDSRSSLPMVGGDCSTFIQRETYNNGWIRFIDDTNCGEYGQTGIARWYQGDEIKLVELKKLAVVMPEDEKVAPYRENLQYRISYEAGKPSSIQFKKWKENSDPASVEFKTTESMPEEYGDMAPPLGLKEQEWKNSPGVSSTYPLTFLEAINNEVIFTYQISPEDMEHDIIITAKGFSAGESNIQQDASVTTLLANLDKYEGKKAFVEYQTAILPDGYAIPVLTKVTWQ